METIGLIGVGVMGRTVAAKVIEGGYPVLAYDVSSGCIEKAAALGAAIAPTPADVARQARIVLMLLPGPAEVKACVAGPGGLLDAALPGTVVVDMATSDPATTVEMAELARARSVGYVDAPVLGRPSTVGKWALPAGGRPEEIERCRTVLALFAAHVPHVGPSGSGHKIKLLNQMMFGAINAMTAEMMAVAERIGIAPKLLFDTITLSQAGTVSNLFKELGGRVAEGRYEDPTFTVDLLIKDVALGVKMAREGGAPPILGRTVELINEVARAQGLGPSDTSAMWQSYLHLWSKKPQA
jgi:3-hydroxyisobutyrate dehydrogenase-like beta-hydroxyacid dehydrogenase